MAPSEARTGDTLNVRNVELNDSSENAVVTFQHAGSRAVITVMDLSRDPKVSVIVPAHNHERYIEAALDSARDEGYPNLEIVLMDDGSTDGTWDRVGAWQERNAGLLTVQAMLQDNVGLTKTLNRLLHLASGEYVAMLASDDRLLPGGLGSRVDLLEARPDLIAVFADARVIDANGRVTSEHAVGFGDPRARVRLLDDPAREIVERWSVPGPVMVYRRDEVRAMGGYSEALTLEDWDLYLRLASRNAIAYLDQVVAEYRWHGDNTVARPEQAILLADELRAVAWRSRTLFRGHLRLELMHEAASWAARAARLRRRWHAWLGWKAGSITMKTVAMAVPRRPSDQAGARSV